MPPSRTLRALAGYEHPTQLAVCPECAGYALDIAAQGNRYGFRCQTCRAHWDWRPGEGWPPVRSPGS
ncbi:hypothetical protein [Actinomycetospora termitidis]|uniref:Uncharacterized protein n=1 Tax=Actinomycetospora termitidis TaxID=3053470 RepID=A0ABT7ME96_9PSEU|nr:hypothetical protein [Actinomycetospora sp. Odt1-22]MDL5158986.1 hypothetical protein [Actinomycetospora sp. Odt1-22]